MYSSQAVDQDTAEIRRPLTMKSQDSRVTLLSRSRIEHPVSQDFCGRRTYTFFDTTRNQTDHGGVAHGVSAIDSEHSI